MSVSEIITIGIICAVIIFLACVIVRLLEQVIRLLDARIEDLKMKELVNARLIDEYDRKNLAAQVEYSDSVIDFIKKVVGTVAIFKVRTFVDGKDLSKITEANVKKLADETAIEVNKVLDRNRIRFNMTIYDAAYYDQFIVNTVIVVIKDMIDKEIKAYKHREEYGEE